MRWIRIVAPWIAAFICIQVVTVIAARLFGIPAADIPSLTVLLTGVAMLVGTVVVLLLRPLAAGKVGGVRTQLMGLGLASSVILLALMLAGSRAMFISQHDLSVLLTMLLFSGLLAIGISWLAAIPMTRRIERVRAATHQLAGGALETTIDASGHDEIADLAHDFNRMAVSLRGASARERETEQARRNLIAAVSHDLRAPLAAARALIEALADDVVTDAVTRERYLEIAQRELQQLGHLIDDVFELAQIDAGVLRLRIERASLNDLISDTLASVQPQAERCGVALMGDVAEDVDPVFIDPARIQRVLRNVLENALRHTPAGGTIVLSSRRAGDSVDVEVTDTGEGIPPDHLPHVFERSYRGDRARTRPEAGDAARAGLGLTIARGLVEAHGGTMRIESVLGSGTRLMFTLPRP